MFGLYTTPEVLAYMQGWLKGANVSEGFWNTLQTAVSKYFRTPPANHWASVLSDHFPTIPDLAKLPDILNMAINKVAASQARAERKSLKRTSE